ncbi:hypothetical protein [Streptomyces sp. NPDC002176]|uniref:hypothetical protein n=1 Tax=Streptomyces sp. NPDC002176 TaxID=3364634 RepID=UPI00384AA7E9
MPELHPRYQALADAISAISMRVHRTSWAWGIEHEVWHLREGSSAGWDLVGDGDLRPIRKL